MKKILCFILALVLLAACVPGMQAQAATAQDLTYVRPDDVDVWENGNGIGFSYAGITGSIPDSGTNISSYTEYAVIVSRYLDTDEEYITDITAYFYYGDKRFYYRTDEVTLDDNGLAYYPIYAYSKSGGMFSSTQALIYNIRFKNGRCIEPSTGELMEEGKYLINSSSASGKSYCQVGKIYATPLTMGQYLIYSSCCLEYEKETLGFPVNLLPTVPSGSGDTEMPYKTTFRMLTEGAATYNTYYYTSCYLAGDNINAAGKIRCDSTVLTTGATTRTLLAAPQLLCQISSYGTVYDIVYTNDEALCGLLGIEMPSTFYKWDVTSQEWKVLSSSTGGSGSNGSSGIDSSLLVEDTVNLSAISSLTVKLVGEDALIDAVTFNNYYAGQIWHSNKLEYLDTAVWGLGNYVTWNYSGKLYDAVETDNGSGALLEQSKNHRRVKLVVKAKFRIDSTTTKTLTYTLYDYDTGQGIPVSTGSWKISFYDLCLFFSSAYPEYVTDFPSQLQQVSYYFTPFYYDKDTGLYHYGETSSISQNVKSALADYSGGEWDGDNGGWTMDYDSNWSEDVLNWIGSLTGFVKNTLGGAKDLFGMVADLPLLLKDFVPCIPTEIWSIMVVCLSAYFLIPAIIAVRGVIKAVGK